MIVIAIVTCYQLPQAYSKSWFRRLENKIEKHVPSPKKITKSINKIGKGLGNTFAGAALTVADIATLKNPKENFKKATNGTKDIFIGSGEAVKNTLEITVHGGVAVVDGTVQHLEIDVMPHLEEALCMGNENCINGGVIVNDDGEVVFTDSNGKEVEKPEPSNEERVSSSNLIDQKKETFFQDIEVVLNWNDYWPGVDNNFQIAPPNGTGKIRNDDKGYGFQFAPRYREKRYDHNGVDYKAKTGDPAYAPVPGKIVRISNAYEEKICYDPDYMKTEAFRLEQSLKLKCIVIANNKNNQYEAKVMYVSPHNDLKVGDTVEAHQFIGTVQSQDRPHIHLEIRDPNKKPLIIPVKRNESHPENFG